jgi:hypothetical protein
MRMSIGSRKLSEVIWVFMPAILLIGCSAGEQGLVLAENGLASFDPNGSIVSYQKVLFDQAVVEQIAPHKADCPSSERSSKNAKVCIRICHIPPGNPKAARQKILPIQAMRAHVGHGDFLGPCEDGGSGLPPSGEVPEGGGNPSQEEYPPTEATPVPGESAPEATPTPSPPPSGEQSGGQVPKWCADFIQIDSNCDGINDSTGESYF